MNTSAVRRGFSPSDSVCTKRLMSSRPVTDSKRNAGCASSTREHANVVSDAPLLRWRVEFERDGKSVGWYGVGMNFLEIYPRVANLKPQEQQTADRLLTNK